MANPRRGVGEEAVRVQEFTGGFNGREMIGDYDVNPNENADGLAHHSREAAANESLRTQADPKKRRQKALREMAGDLPHISVKPEKISDTLSSTPQSKDNSTLREGGTGLDMGTPSGIAASNGGQVGPIRREGPGLLFGRSHEIVEDVWGLLKEKPVAEQIFDAEAEALQHLSDEAYKRGHRVVGGYMGLRSDGGRSYASRGVPVAISSRGATDDIMDDELSDYELAESFGTGPTEPEVREAILESAEGAREAASEGGGDVRTFIPVPPHKTRPSVHPDMIDQSLNQLELGVGEFSLRPSYPGLHEGTWQEKNASEDPVFLSDISKGKRRKRGRKYEDDEESDADEKKSKAKRRRKRKRKMKEGKKEASRDIKGKTARRAAAAEQNLNRETRRQSFAPRRMFSGNPRASSIPLRIRDPVAYQRKLANERMRREQGALPRDITVHRDTRGLQGDIQTIGRGTRFGASAPKGTSMRSFKPPKNAEASAALLHDALGGDALKMEKASKGLTRNELLRLKNQLEKLVRLVESLKKSPPVFDENSKRGNQASPQHNSEPTGPTEPREEEKAPFRFEDPTTLMTSGVVGKR